MTLLYIDGFAHNNTARYVGSPAWGSMSGTSSPRVAGSYYGVISTGAAGYIKRLVTASTEVFSGIGFWPVATGEVVLTFFSDTGNTQHVTLMVNGSNKLELRRGSSTGSVIATGTATINLNQWRYIECRCIIDDTTGVFQVRLDGGTAYDIDFTGDTRNSGTSTSIDAVGTKSQAAANLVSDWYILNTVDTPTGTPCKTWLGDVAVRTLAPNGDGATSGLTGSDGNSTSNYQLVDELPPSSTDYVGATVGGGLKDTYALPDLPGAVTAVLGVQVDASMAKTDAGAATGQIVTRVGGTDYAPDTTTLATSYAETLKLWTADPSGAAWTSTTVNDMEIGMAVP